MNLIANISAILTITITYLCIRKGPQTKSFQWIIWYCILNTIIEFISFILAEFKLSNLFLFQFLIIIESVIILNYFKLVSITVNKYTGNWLILALTGLYLFQYNSLTNLNPFNAILEGMIVFTCSLTYLSDELRIPKSNIIVYEPNFWFVTAFLLYYGCTWLLLLCAQYVITETNIFNYVWNVQNIFNIIKYIIIFLGIRFLK